MDQNQNPLSPPQNPVPPINYQLAQSSDQTKDTQGYQQVQTTQNVDQQNTEQGTQNTYQQPALSATTPNTLEENTIPSKPKSIVVLIATAVLPIIIIAGLYYSYKILNSEPVAEIEKNTEQHITEVVKTKVEEKIEVTNPTIEKPDTNKEKIEELKQDTTDQTEENSEEMDSKKISR